jgi:hypothetical protein
MAVIDAEDLKKDIADLMVQVDELQKTSSHFSDLRKF